MKTRKANAVAPATSRTPGVHCCLRKLRATATRPSPTRVAGMIILASASRLYQFPARTRRNYRCGYERPPLTGLQSSRKGLWNQQDVAVTAEETAFVELIRPHPRNSLQVKPGDPALPRNFPGDLDNCSIVLTSQEESNPPEAEYERT